MTALAPHALQAFTPTGTLRATINLGNPILARRDDAGGPAGVSVDLARAFADRLGVPLTLVVLDSAGKAVDTVSQEDADIGFSPSPPRAPPTSPSPTPTC